MMQPDDPNYPPRAILDALKDAFPKSFDTVMQNLSWSSLMECWMTEIHGTIVGIEKDGYIHS